jgi:4-carboxymuconolactone decarboxylase
MKVHSDKYNSGLNLLNKIHGGHAGETIIEKLNEISPDYAKSIIQFGFGEVLNREGLPLKTRQLIFIATCITLGNPMPQLQANIEGALNVGATKDEIVEVIYQTALYAGFAYCY